MDLQTRSKLSKPVFKEIITSPIGGGNKLFLDNGVPTEERILSLASNDALRCLEVEQQLGPQFGVDYKIFGITMNADAIAGFGPRRLDASV